MKIQKVIHSCDDKEFYSDFWPIVSKIWKLKFNIEPVLLYFGTGNPTEEYGEVIKMEILPDVPINTQCQLSRYWIPVTEPETVWMTSDIDMLPISKNYFIKNIETISDDKFISMNSDPREIYPHILYQCCYNVAKGRTFTELLDINPSWKEFMSTGFYKENTYTYTPDGLVVGSCRHWGADECWSSGKINKFKDQKRIIRQYRKCGRHQCHRIDRIDWKWTIGEVRNDKFYDCHSLRPYKAHKESIDKLVELILET